MFNQDFMMYLFNVISYLSSFVFAFHLIKMSKAFIHTLFFFLKKTTWFLLSSSNTLGWYLARKNDTCINNHRLLNDFCTVLYVYTCNADIINFKCLEILSQFGVFFVIFVCLGKFQRIWLRRRFEYRADPNLKQNIVKLMYLARS